ncbi:hypothetical protein LCGC14_0603840 [marine sediment metagenome]|uniref:Baseplate protein J-like domain-containing protein n=1 Tax=marine sediment metagenome TaxID=412755 RepID=A0A0F9REK1_9ZZZZ
MTTESTLTFADIDPELIEQSKEYLRQLLAEEFPSMDLTQSRVFHDNLLLPAAILHSVNREDYDRLRRSFSPVEIQEDPDLADDEIVDSVYANYGIERYTGDKATGLIAVIIEDSVTTAVPETTIFTVNSFDYVVDQPYIGVTTQDAVVSDQERLITERTDGTFVFTVPVTAEQTGEAYRARRGARFTASPSIPGTIELQAAADFEGGNAAETNAELAERASAGIAPRVFSGRIQIESLFREELPTLRAVSQVGLGDPEMLRDRHNLFAMSNGGKADLYVQTADVPNEIKLVKECTYIGDQAWQFTILRDDAPGFYLVTAVVEKDLTNFQGSLEITDEVRGTDLTKETDWVQQIEDGQLESAYSCYQTAVVKFTDPTTADDVAVGTKVEYDVYVSVMSDIKLLNDLTVERGRRPEGGDYLVRAAVPAYMSVSLLVLQRSGTQTPDSDAIKQAVASRINGLGFSTGRIDSALVIDAAMGALETRGTAVIQPLDMQAFIYPPDTVPLGRLWLRDSHLLEIPDLPERGVTQRTTVFYLPIDAIAVAIQPMPAVAV